LTLLAVAAPAAPKVQITTLPKSALHVNAPPVVPAAAAPQTWFQVHVGWLTHGVAGLFIIAAIALVVLLAVQTTKQEGLSGTIGGRVESSYGRMGAEEQLKRITGFAAVVFVLTGFVLSLTGI
jgi:preprotein translocase subunit SecG